MFNGRRVDVSVLGICSRSTCFRRIHRNTCLRLPIYEYLARGGRRDEFICPAHSCLTCYTEKRGIWSYATRFFFSCALCPSVYHSDEWCIPAGSVWVIVLYFLLSFHRCENGLNWFTHRYTGCGCLCILSQRIFFCFT